MTDLANRLNFPVRPHRTNPPGRFSCWPQGCSDGLTLGIMARAWMRLISENPEFTWNGTIFIVGGFTVFGFTQSVVAVARRRARAAMGVDDHPCGWDHRVDAVVRRGGRLDAPHGRRRRSGKGPGRVEPRRPLDLLSLAVVPILIVGVSGLVDSFGWSLHAFVGFLAMVALYATIVSATRFTFTAQADGWRIKRWVTITLYVVLGLLVLQFTVGFILR